MRDLIIFKYLVLKYCVKWSIIIPMFFLFVIDLILTPIQTIVLFLLITFGSNLFVWLKFKNSHRDISGIFSVVLSEIIYPTLFICVILQKL